MQTPLRLNASSRRAIYKPGDSIPIQLQLTNVSEAAICVNKRMAPGYRTGFNREIFFDVYDSSTGELIPAPENERVDVHRMPPSRVDFQTLAPGDSVESVLDAHFWHRFSQPGTYRIVFTYENTHDGREFGLEPFTGSIVSDPHVITSED